MGLKAEHVFKLDAHPPIYIFTEPREERRFHFCHERESVQVYTSTHALHGADRGASYHKHSQFGLIFPISRGFAKRCAFGGDLPGYIRAKRHLSGLYA